MMMPKLQNTMLFFLIKLSNGPWKEDSTDLKSCWAEQVMGKQDKVLEFTQICPWTHGCAECCPLSKSIKSSFFPKKFKVIGFYYSSSSPNLKSPLIISSNAQGDVSRPRLTRALQTNERNPSYSNRKEDRPTLRNSSNHNSFHAYSQEVSISSIAQLLKS